MVAGFRIFTKKKNSYNLLKFKVVHIIVTFLRLKEHSVHIYLIMAAFGNKKLACR